jgi:hypothetical protein
VHLLYAVSDNSSAERMEAGQSKMSRINVEKETSVASSATSAVSLPTSVASVATSAESTHDLLTSTKVLPKNSSLGF